MPDSVSDQRPGKRERLVTSATGLFRRRGVQQTTLAQVAEAADVPPGNVYYYFKTREELIGAVIEDQRGEVLGLLSQLDTLDTPVERLQGLAASWADNSQIIVEGGCPIGGLSYELAKTNPGLAHLASGCVRTLLDWSER